MSLDDFCRCTPSEFHAVYTQWHDHGDALLRHSWEQTRALCLRVLAPWSRRGLRAEEVLPLPWDTAAREDGEEELSAEERAARYEAAKRRYGIA